MIFGGAIVETMARKHSKEVVIVILLALVLCALIPCHGLAQTSVVITADDQFRFAENYFQRGEYYRAISEYERFIHFFPKEPRVESARYKIGLSCFEGRHFKDAVQSFSGLIEQYHDTELSMKSYLKMSECYVKLKEFDEALNTLEALLKIAQDQDTKDEALYRRGWIYLETNEWEKAQASFDQISPKNRDEYRLQELSEEMKKKELLKTKNPTAAGLSAIVPGAGHLYCGRKRDAMVAFLLNGAMIFAAVEAFDNDNEALGGLLTFFEIGLYSGNIYSAVNSAHKYNRKQKHDFLEYLRGHSVFGISRQRLDEGQAMALCCKITF
jgi:tetratricopeptide (TPR) repeat protein